MNGDMLRGGKGDRAKPSDFDPQELKRGIEVEMEHTKSRRIAREIALDHLSEDPRYYSKLKKIHRETVARPVVNQIEELLQLMVGVHSWLNEGATPPPPPAAAFNRGPIKKPAAPIARKTGTPPPIPADAKKNMKPSKDVDHELGVMKAMSAQREHGKREVANARRVAATGTPIMQRTDSKGQRKQSFWDSNKDHGTKGMGITRSFFHTGGQEAPEPVQRRIDKKESVNGALLRLRDMLSESHQIKRLKPMSALKPNKAMKPLKKAQALKAMKPMKAMKKI